MWGFGEWWAGLDKDGRELFNILILLFCLTFLLALAIGGYTAHEIVEQFYPGAP